ncbi:galactoside O-acetyltransferase [Vibrio astriarenae]|nr:galactoside O-acetyltransferase [Vibrio sp. C7]
MWIGANTTVCAGVTIGNGSVIGAGSVVTKDIPAGVIAYGNPCRVVREITEDDKWEFPSEA